MREDEQMPSLVVLHLSFMRKCWSRGTEGQDSRSVKRFIIGSLAWDDRLPSHLRNIFCDHRSLCLRAKGGVVIQSWHWEKKTPTLLSVLVVLSEWYMPREVSLTSASP